MKKIMFLTLAILLLLSACTAQETSEVDNQSQIATSVAGTVESIASTLAAEQVDPTPAPSATPEATVEPTQAPTEEPTATLSPSLTPTLAPSPTATIDPATLEDACDVAAFVADITVPDGTEFDPGESFTKTWELRNVGTCTWDSNYLLVFFSGDDFQAPVTQTLTTAPVAPGQSLQISVDLVAPTDPGRYIAYWLLRNAEGDNFGIGVDGDTFFVDITVIDPNATATPTPTATASTGG
ncbi:MAG: hypothetical protein JW862_14460 [Anaerolineales bacterium]|nr:hypothetical protein [Anaerolineales bacterium]